MNLIFLFGPPAVGKLTIATEISRCTDHKLFHNHLTVPVADEIFPQGSLQHNKLLKKIRLNVIGSAAEFDQNLVFTTGYSGARDDDFVDEIVEAVTRNGGDVYFVQLSAPLETLMERVKNESRKKYAKIETPEQLDRFIANAHGDIFASMPRQNVLQIDTSALEPQEIARKIIENFGLTKIHS